MENDGLAQPKKPGGIHQFTNRFIDEGNPDEDKASTEAMNEQADNSLTALIPCEGSLSSTETSVICEPQMQLDTLLTLLNVTDQMNVREAMHLTSTTQLLEKKYRNEFGRAIKVRSDLLLMQMRTANSLPLKRNPVSTSHAQTLDNLDFMVGPPGSTLCMYFESSYRLFGSLLGTTGVSLGKTDQERLNNGLYLWQENLGSVTLNRSSVAGAAVMGLIQWLILILSTTPDNPKMARRLRRSAESRFSELLDVADLLALKSDKQTINCARDYHGNGRSWRARRLLRYRSEHAPSCAATEALLARVLDDSGRDNEALNAYRRAVDLEPDSPEQQHALGLAALRRLKFDRALSSLGKACELAPEDPTVKNDLECARRLKVCLQSADRKNTMPGIDLDEHEQANRRFRPETLSVAAELYRKHGTLRIGGAFDPAVISRCREQFMQDYRHYFTDEKKADALQIGNRRFQVSITLSGAFNNPDLYANPFILTLMRRLLGKRMVIGSTVCATSLPGAKDQHWHKDHRALFTQDEDEKPIALPPVAVTTMIPLVDLDEQIGTTMVRKGSHLLGEQASAQLHCQVPIVPAGSCFLMDLSLSHKGQGNQTDNIRPIVNMVYHQSWFNDNKNFKLQRPLHVPPEEFRQMPEEHRSLVSWAIQPGPLVNA